MSSIILSFVGTQDPYSDRTKEEGSIVTLVKHLLADKSEITCLYLLFTHDLHERAELTEQWLKEEIGLTIKIELIPVCAALSEDPIDIYLATNAAKQALVLARSRAAEGDMFEFNFSSGTPTMKSTWSVLQAAGYAPHSRVWQVRNPSEMRVGQPRVFAADSSILKAEFDRNVIQQQLANYNYSGALATIENSGLNNKLVIALLNYGRCRSSFDFDGAENAIGEYKDSLSNELVSDIGNLRQKDERSLLKEVYFSAKISIENREYCDFLIAVSQFQENILRFFLTQIGLNVSSDIRGMEDFWNRVRQHEDRSIYLKLEQSNNRAISLRGNLNIPTMIEIIELSNKHTRFLPKIAKLKEYCDRRNKYIHRLEGVSHIDDAQAVLDNIKNLLQQLTKIPDTNPFKRLNKDILSQLETNTRSA